MSAPQADTGADGRSLAIALDRPRRLRYTYNSLCRLQELLGPKVDQVLTAGPKTSFAEIRVLLWCGLIKDDPTLTLEGAGEAIQAYLEAHPGDLAGLVDLAVRALYLSGLLTKEAAAKGTEAAPPAAAAGAEPGPFVSAASSTSPSAPPSTSA